MANGAERSIDGRALRLAAASLADHPHVAAALVAVAEGRATLTPDGLVERQPDDPLRLRRRLLRRLWQEHYGDSRRTAAARLIAAAWADLDPTRPTTPDSRADLLRRLADAGFRPLAWRQIADDLDSALYPD